MIGNNSVLKFSIWSYTPNRRTVRYFTNNIGYLVAMNHTVRERERARERKKVISMFAPLWNVYGQYGEKKFFFSSLVIASRPFRLRSKCSICSRRFESRRWSHWGQALSSGFLDIGRDHPSSLGPVPRIISTLQCRRVWSTPVSLSYERNGSSYLKREKENKRS